MDIELRLTPPLDQPDALVLVGSFELSEKPTSRRLYRRKAPCSVHCLCDGTGGKLQACLGKNNATLLQLSSKTGRKKGNDMKSLIRDEVERYGAEVKVACATQGLEML